MTNFVELWLYLSATPLFGLTATLVVYVLAQAGYTRLGQPPWANPVLWSVLVLALLLLATGTPYPTYFSGAQFIHFDPFVGFEDDQASDPFFGSFGGVVGVAALAADLGAIHRERGFGFLGEIGEFGDAGLHLVGHLVLGDAGGDLGIAEVVALDFVEVREVVQHVAANLAAEAGGVRQIEHGIAGAAEGDALILRGEKTAAPVEIIEDLAAAGLFVAGGHDDVGGKLLGLAAEAVAEPCAH
jgi:hypothetical protein